MLHYKLVSDPSHRPGTISEPPKFIIARSSSAHHSEHDIYVPASSYDLVFDTLNSYIPQEWHNSLAAIYREERSLIARRQALISECRTLLPSILTPILDSFPDEYPEAFL